MKSQCSGSLLAQFSCHTPPLEACAAAKNIHAACLHQNAVYTARSWKDYRGSGHVDALKEQNSDDCAAHSHEQASHPRALWLASHAFAAASL